MISDYKIAKEVADVLEKCYDNMNDTVVLVQEKCNEEELNSFRKAVGLVMGYLYTDVLSQLYKVHPELETDDRKDK